MVYCFPGRNQPYHTVHCTKCTHPYKYILLYSNRCYCWFDTHIWCSKNNSASMTCSIFKENYSIVMFCVFVYTLMCRVSCASYSARKQFAFTIDSRARKNYTTRLYKIDGSRSDKNHIATTICLSVSNSFRKLTSVDRLFIGLVWLSLRKWGNT